MKNPFSRREAGLTLVELLAAIVSVTLVLGAATGLAITAIARQKVEFDAAQLETQHAELANAIFNAIKTSDSFQIFDSSHSAETSSLGSYGIGVPSGNYLSCRHNFTVGGGSRRLVEQNFEFVPGSADRLGTLVQTIRFLSTNQQQVRKEFSGVFAAGPLFSMKNGIPQAHWSISTTLDRADFNVYAMPLSMR
jgi:Tfp pilus assembly protein FimT